MGYSWTRFLEDDTRVAPPRPARLVYGDGIRVLATLAVVLIHVCGFERRPSFTDDPGGWWVCNVCSAASQWAVPVFVMLSGALLLDSTRTESVAVFARKRALRVGVPLVFWSLFYLRWSHPGGVTDETMEYVKRGQPYYHLYFLFIISGLYLITLPLRRLVTVARPWLVLLLAIAMLLGAMLWVWLRHGDTARSAWLQWLPYPGYYLLGWCLRKRRDDALVPGIALAVALAGALAVMAGEARLVADPNSMDWAERFVFRGHFSPVVLVYSVAVFVGVREALYRERRLFTQLGEISLGIYLLHPFVLELLRGIGLDCRWHTPAIGVPTTTVVLCVVCGAITLGLQRVKYVRSLVGGG